MRSPSNPTASRFAAALLSLLILASAALGQSFQAAGDGRHLWIVSPPPGKGDPTVLLYHADPSLPADGIERVTERQGRLAPGGLAVSGGQAWLVYDKFHVQSFRVDSDARPPEPRFPTPRDHPQLPGVASLIGFTADAQGPWALVRIEDAAALAAIDAPQSGTQPTTTPATAPQTQAVEASTQPSTAPVRADRLLRLDRGQWKKAELPSDWPRQRRAWIVSLRPDAPWPVLATPSPDGERLWVYEHNGEAWERHEFSFDATDAAALAVEGQLVFARRREAKDSVSLDVTLLRPDQVIPIGTIALPAGQASMWDAASADAGVALIGADPEGKLAWSRLSLRGKAVPPAPLQIQVPNPLFDPTGQSLMIMLLVASLLIMFAVWRRDGPAAQPQFPPGYGAADLIRRVGAALVDLGPCIAIAATVFQRSPREIVGSWSGTALDLELLPATLLAIGLFVLHTGLSELFTAQTLGKKLMGLRVASVNGQPPHVWQVLARNVFKIFDLLAWPLLILPVIKPHGQRLGDMVARTVVVMPQEPEPADKPGRDDEP